MRDRKLFYATLLSSTGNWGAEMFRASFGLLGSLLMACRAMSDTPLPDWYIKSSLDGSQTVILVHVIESTFHRGDSPLSSSSMDARAKVSVLRSWKGPFSRGNLVHVVPDVICTGSCGAPFAIQKGEEVLIFTNSTEDPVAQGLVLRAAEAQAAMTTLDQAVKEQQELEDPHTDLIRAPERNRVMLALKKCFADASAHPKSEYLYPRCSLIDVSVLRGIKRSALVANWGPPTWCQRLNGTGPTEYSAPAGTDCPPEQMPIWSFGRPGTPGSGLWCSPERNLRFMGIEWIIVSGK